ncbi:GntR family transcriptional regulator [Bradyrhizobium brasilense]|nr:GntR family transcriptional regulator [Bradyrhizobium brasilense]
MIEQTIAAECGVSRVPLREAIRILASEGLVTISPHRGASVSVLSGSELNDLFGARAAIEAAAARSAAKRQNAFAIETLGRILKQMRQAVALNELATYYALAGEFHRALVEAGGNAVMLKLYDQIRGQLRRYQAAMSALPELPKRSNLEHARILQAIEKGDAEAAYRAAEGHIDALVRQFQQSDSDNESRQQKA